DRQQHHRAHRREREPQHLIFYRQSRCRLRRRIFFYGVETVHRQERGPRAEEREQREQQRPAPAELLQVEHRLEQHRKAEQREQRSEVREREQAIRHGAAKAAPVPRLQERRGRGEQEVRQADGRDEEQEDARDRLLLAARLPAARGDDRQAGERDDEQPDVQQRLPARAQARGEIGVGVSREQHALEKHEARGPDPGRAAEPRQDLLGDDRLDQEQQERRKEDRRRVRQRGYQGIRSYQGLN